MKINELKENGHIRLDAEDDFEKSIFKKMKKADCLSIVKAKSKTEGVLILDMRLIYLCKARQSKVVERKEIG